MARVIGSIFLKESFPQSDNDRRRRYKQIEDIRNFACALEHFYDRLVQFESGNKTAHE
jgi:hypothetical protein